MIIFLIINDKLENTKNNSVACLMLVKINITFYKTENRCYKKIRTNLCHNILTCYALYLVFYGKREIMINQSSLMTYLISLFFKLNHLISPVLMSF